MDAFLEEVNLLFLVKGVLIPGGGMPIGVPRVGGSPIGGPMGGLIPGGGAIIPRKKNGRKKKKHINQLRW